ncbi:RPM1-interacting protein 4-like protein [Drosera capensis]
MCVRRSPLGPLLHPPLWDLLSPLIFLLSQLLIERDFVQLAKGVVDRLFFSYLASSHSFIRSFIHCSSSMAKSKVPQFGAWHGEEDVAYTVYFDEARKNKNQGQMINPNEPQLYRDLHSQKNPTLRADQVKQEGGNIQKPDSSLSRHGNRSRGSTAQNNEEGTGGRVPIEPRQKPAVQFVGSDADNGVGRSPLHPRAAGGERGAKGPSSFDRNHSSDGAHGTPGRSRPRSVSQTPERGASVPEFGAWNKDPAQAESYTDVFERVSKERKGGETPNNFRTSHNETSRNRPNDEVKVMSQKETRNGWERRVDVEKANSFLEQN